MKLNRLFTVSQRARYILQGGLLELNIMAHEPDIAVVAGKANSRISFAGPLRNEGSECLENVG